MSQAGTLDTSTPSAPNFLVQQERLTYTTFSTSTAYIPLDNSIPQNTEGDEIMTLAITPTSATNILCVEAIVYLAPDNSSTFISAIFQDSLADSLATSMFKPGLMGPLITRFYVVTGDTSARTYKVRVGGTNGGGGDQFQINGDNLTGAIFGGTLNSTLTITEYLA